MHRIHARWAVSLSLFAVLLAAPQVSAQNRAAAAANDPSITLETDVVYTTVNGQDLHMDIARPAQGQGPIPAIICIHGGAWRGGNKMAYRQAILGFAKQGYVAVSVQYRLAPAHRFPAQVEDVKCAVRYLRSRAKELNINPDRIGAMGASAGGHLSLMLGTTDSSAGLEGTGGYSEHSSRVQAVVNYFGPTDLALPYEPNVRPLLTNFIGGTPEEKPQEHKQASPVTHLTRDDAPILTFHGTADMVVPYEQATVLDAACRKIGVSHELVTIENGGHGFQGEENLRTISLTSAFFDKHLKSGR
jgi:acetyl esterase/lipase